MIDDKQGREARSMVEMESDLLKSRRGKEMPIDDGWWR